MAYKITSTFNFPTTPEFWRDWFLQDANRASAWILSARDLLEHIRSTADALRAAWIEHHGNLASHPAAPPSGQHRMYLFLSALAIENLLKAVVVDQAKWPDSQIAQKLPEELKTHALLDLAAGRIDLADDEIELLERLTQFGIWLGRYPTPTKLDDIKPKKLKSGKVNLAGFMYGSDIRDVENFINRLIDKLKGVEGIEHLARFPLRPDEAFEGTSISPNIRAW
jgi:hypothetical protein